MPDDPILQRLDQAIAFHRNGLLPQAQSLYEQIIAVYPLHCDTMYLLGLLHLQQSQNDRSIQYFDRVISMRPKYAGAWNNRGIALCNLGQYDRAIPNFDKALELDRKQPEVWNNRGAALQSLGRFKEAIESFNRALALKHDYAEAWNNRGATWRDLGNFQEALANCQKALELRPSYPKALNNLAMILCELKRYEEALSCLDTALAAAPNYAEAWNSRGNVLWEIKRFEPAMASYNKALALNPNYSEALFNRGNTYWTEYRDYRSAVKDLEKVMQLSPEYDYAAGGLLHLRMQVGDWENFETQMAAIDAGVQAGKKVIEPFAYMALSGSPINLKLCASTQTNDGYPANPQLRSTRGRNRRKIRVGYVSGEFREQATAYLTAGLYEAHDKNQFEIVGFDNGFSDDGPTRKRLELAFDKIVDISKMDDEAAARTVGEEEIDILINLNGYFGKHRMGVFAQRPAPVQVNFLGYPGTLGASYIDYIVADEIVIPRGEARFYSEAIAWLPDTYQVNDSRRDEVGSTTRAEHGLPDKVFVFCSFNQGYKLTPTMFDIWMRILANTHGSVLWILESNKEFAQHLRQAALERGIQSNRIIFAPIVRADQHLARMTLADLFLDTLPCNAHTTASDALWAGLPLVTCCGKAFAGRVATSILKAMNLPELVAGNLKDYEALAIDLANDSGKLLRIRKAIGLRRHGSALFDTARYTRHLEAAYRKMWDIYQSGGAPQNFGV